jgi:hypothetical protein
MSEVGFDSSFVIIAIRWCHSQTAPEIADFRKRKILLVFV